MLSALVTLMLGACTLDQSGYCTDEVVRFELSYEQKDPKVAINTALGDVVSVEVPEGVALRGKPVVGNTAIFKFEVIKEPLKILIWPTVPKGARGVSPELLIGERTNMQLAFVGGITLTVDLQFGYPGESTQRLVLEFPERERERSFVRDKLAEGERVLREKLKDREESLDSEAAMRAHQRISSAMMKRMECSSISDRKMTDLVVVRTKKLCRIGDWVYLHLSVQNRSRTIFNLAAVTIKGVRGAEPEPIEVIETRDEQNGRLAFDDEGAVVAAFPVVDGVESYVVEVIEDGGQSRVITLSGVEF